MQTSINLQGLFDYSLVPLIISISLVIVVVLYLIKSKPKQKSEKIIINEIPEKNIKNLPVIKGKYINELDSIQYRYENQMIDLRTAYQLISEAMRLFVFEVTDITTQNYSLKEIKKLNIPYIYELIEEYYEPEFASKSVGDFKASIEKARRVVKEWN